MVLGGKHFFHSFLLWHFHQSRWTSTAESEYDRDFFGLDYDVGDIVRLDSGDILDEREGLGEWDCFWFVKNVRSLPPRCDPWVCSDLVFCVSEAE